MRKVVAIMALAAVTTLGACKKTGEGEFQVKTPDVDVSTDTNTVRTPSVDVNTRPETTIVNVPDVDVKRPGDTTKRP